ncbi:MAG: cbb3-type cytochrome c oxidase N-terminal domain-containing protein [Planctomycetota bacterium]
MSDAVNDPTTGHIYDGIQEYDNPLPGWWTLLFYLTIVFSACYYFVSLVRAEWTDTNLRYEAAKTRELQRQFAEIGELEPDAATLLSFLQDPEKAKWLDVGSAIFQTNCVSCHGRDGAGVSGPNMTDDHYIKVKTIEDVAKTVIEGSVTAGMPAWSTRLSTNEIVLVSSYVASLRGQNLPGPRGAEGEIIPAWGATN